MWDLQRNGGSVQATTERVLGGRALDSVSHTSMVYAAKKHTTTCLFKPILLTLYLQPPPSFQPQIPQSIPAAPAAPTSQQAKAALPDLITRYNLSSKIAPNGQDIQTSTTSGSDTTKPQAWSQSKTERSDHLRRRREEMILAARRKLEAKDKQESAQG